MPLEVAALGNEDEEEDYAPSHNQDDYLEVGPELDIYSLGRTIDWLLNQSPLRYTPPCAMSKLLVNASHANRANSGRSRKQQERPLRLLTRKMQNADPDQRPSAKEAQELFRQAFPEEFALHPDLPSNLP
jgi:hypothetical protein